MEKGARVRITGGRNGRDKTGEIFWVGPDKYNEGGSRFGVRGDDGETYWVGSDFVEVTTDAAPAPDLTEQGPVPSKGDVVNWTKGEATGSGKVFWIGESKRGPGKRLGIEDHATGETLWLDSRFVTPMDKDAAPMPASPGRPVTSPYRSAARPAPLAAPTDLPPAPEMPVDEVYWGSESDLPPEPPSMPEPDWDIGDDDPGGFE